MRYCNNCGRRVMFGFVSNARFDAHEAYCDRTKADIKKSIAETEDRQRLQQVRMHGENAARISGVERDIRWMLRGVIAILLSMMAMVIAVVVNHITWHM